MCTDIGMRQTHIVVAKSALPSSSGASCTTNLPLHLDNLTCELSIVPTILGLSEILEKLELPSNVQPFSTLETTVDNRDAYQLRVSLPAYRLEGKRQSQEGSAKWKR